MALNTEAELERLWVKQLYLEYERIVYTFRLKLQPVVIALVPFEKRWGEWDPRTRTISLAQALPRTHAWDIVLEVLKHEMAHQMVSELYGARQEAPHGPLFKQACARLGMAAWAQASALPLSADTLQASTRSLSPLEEGLLRRAKKLLALAASSNENEAFIAMKKVQELYERYHLEHIVRLAKPDYASALINHQRKRIETYQAKIASLLVRHFHVQVVYASLFDAKTCSEHKVIELMGAAHHVEMAEYVYWFLYNNLKILWAEQKTSLGGRALSRRSHFLQGVVAGFDEKLQKARKEHKIHLSTEDSPHVGEQVGTSLLVKKEEERLAAFVSYRYPRLRTTYTYAAGRDWDAYQAGQKKGRELTLHRGVARHDGYQGKLLE